MKNLTDLLYLLANPREPMVKTKGYGKRLQFVSPSNLLVRKSKVNNFIGHKPKIQGIGLVQSICENAMLIPSKLLSKIKVI